MKIWSKELQDEVKPPISIKISKQNNIIGMLDFYDDVSIVNPSWPLMNNVVMRNAGTI